MKVSVERIYEDSGLRFVLTVSKNVRSRRFFFFFFCDALETKCVKPFSGKR